MSQRKDAGVGSVLARNFVRFREESGLSQTQAADRAGVSLSTLTKIEQGVNGPSQSTLARFASVYGHDLSHFYMDDPPPAREREQQIWMAKIAPGVDVDDDLRLRVEKFLREMDREQLRRIREKRGLPPKK